MKKIILLSFLLLLLSVLPAAGYQVIFTEEYAFPDGSDLPGVLDLYKTVDCGSYSISLTHWPLVTKSMNSIVGDYDFQYLTVRVAITNNSEETVGWLAPQSFGIKEVYRNRIYGTYTFDPLMSAKGAKGFSLNAFYSPIAPGATLYTMLIFDVFPEADSWIFTFSPHVLGEEPGETLEFTLPAAVFQ